jgi:hypothetical protein
VAEVDTALLDGVLLALQILVVYLLTTQQEVTGAEVQVEITLLHQQIVLFLELTVLEAEAVVLGVVETTVMVLLKLLVKAAPVL